MDKQTIQQHLYDIAQEEISDVNLLPIIKQQLQKPQPARPSFVMMATRFAAVFVIFVLASAAGIAFYQQTYSDPSVPQDRVIALDMAETVDDVTVRLDTAYADAHRANINLIIERPQSVDYGSVANMQLMTADGTVIPSAFGGGGGGGGGNADGDALIIGSMTANFDMTAINPMPETLDLVFIVTLGQQTFAPPQGQGGSGGGGGGGGGGNAPEGSTPPVVTEINDRSYRFEFGLPVIPAVAVEPLSDTVSNNDVTMSISDVRYTPSVTKFTLCYDNPDGGVWLPQINIETGIEGATFTGSIAQPPADDASGEICVPVDALAAITADTNAVTVRIPNLYQQLEPTPELIEEETAFFAEQGYDVRFDWNEEMGFMMGFMVESYPEGVDRDEGYRYVTSTMFREQYEGEWVFDIPLE